MTTPHFIHKVEAQADGTVKASVKIKKGKLQSVRTWMGYGLTRAEAIDKALVDYYEN